jgi:hypothetical protein
MKGSRRSTVVDGTRNARLLRRMLFVSVVAVSGLAAAVPTAAADPCPPLDAGCTLGDPGTTVGGTVGDTSTTAGGVVDDTTTTAGGVVQDTTTTVGGVLGGDVPPDPGPIVGGVPGGILPGNGGVPPGGDDTTSGGGATPPGGAGAPGGNTQAGPPSPGSQGGPTAVVRDPGPGVFSTPSGDASTTVSHPFPSLLDDASVGASLSGARLVRTFAFPLALILLVIGFVFVQNLIDRKDPKLALAPVGSDYLTFS